VAAPFAWAHSDELLFALDVPEQDRAEAHLVFVVGDLEDADAFAVENLGDEQLPPTPADRSADPHGTNVRSTPIRRRAQLAVP